MSALHSRITDPVLRRVVQPQNILEMGMAFWSTRVVVAAVEFGVFTQLAAGPLSGEELMDKLGWHSQAAGSVLDALVVLGLLRRDRAGRYSNSRRAALFLDRAKPSYLGGLMELSSRRLFNLLWGLGDLLQTGRPGAAEERGDNEFFSALYRDPAALRSFLIGMTGISTGEAALIAARFPWKRFRSFVDIGAAQGALPVRVALTHPHLTGASYDLAAVGPILGEPSAIDEFPMGRASTCAPAAPRKLRPAAGTDRPTHPYRGGVRDRDLRPRHVVAMTLLHLVGEQSQSDLGEALRVDRTNLVGLLNDLEDAD